MGIIIQKKDFRILDKASLLKPIIHCSPDEWVLNSAFSLNVPLAERLLVIKSKRRAMRMAQCFQQILSGLSDNIIIKDFDVMFHPDYQIDVLRLLIEQYKVKPFEVIWPGRYEDGRLIYAEEGYRDYKVFEISKYDVTVVV